MRTREDGNQSRIFDFSANRFSPWTWWRSAARREVRAWRPDDVVLQLPEPGTIGSVSLGLVALWMAPRGFWFVLPTGEMQFMPPSRWLEDLSMRAAWRSFAWTAIVLIAAAAFVTWPIYQLSRARASRSGA